MESEKVILQDLPSILFIEAHRGSEWVKMSHG